MTANEQQHPRANFARMEASTQDDWKMIVSQFLPYAKALPDRILDHLRLLDGDFGGFPVDRLTHSLQTATRACRDDRDEEYVVCACYTTSATRSARTTIRISPPRFSSRSSRRPTIGWCGITASFRAIISSTTWA